MGSAASPTWNGIRDVLLKPRSYRGCGTPPPGVGWQRRCKTFRSRRELDHQGAVFLFFPFGGHHDGYLVRPYCAGWRTLTPHKGNDRITQCECGKAPTRQLHSNTRCYLWSGHTKKQRNSLAMSSGSKKVGTRCRSPSYEQSLEKCSSPYMRLAERPHSASRLVQAMSAWLVKTRRAPSRHSRDARVYGHTTTAMHKLSTPHPPSPPQTCKTNGVGTGVVTLWRFLRQQENLR